MPNTTGKPGSVSGEDARPTPVDMSRTTLDEWRIAHWLAVALIVAGALVLRLYRLDLMEYKYDQIVAAAMARDVAEGRGLPPHGLTSSLGVPNPPLFIWILGGFALVSPAPLFLAGGVAVLNAGATGLLCMLFRRRWPASVVLTAAALFATAPWAAIYSRCIWAQDLLPVLLIPFWHCLLTFLDTRRRAHGAACIVLLALAAQIHLSAAFLAPAVLIILAIRRLLFTKAILLGAAVGLLTYIPYLVWIGGHWSEAVALLQQARRAAPPGQPSHWPVYGGAVSLGLRLDYLLGPAWIAFAQSGWTIWGQRIAAIIVAALACAGLDAVARVRAEARLSSDITVALAICAGAMLLYLVLSIPPYPHYFIVMLPWAFVLAGAGAWTITQRIRTSRHVVRVVIVTVAGIQSATVIGLLNYIAIASMARTEYGAPYRDVPAAMVAQTLLLDGRPHRASVEFQRALLDAPADRALRADLALALAMLGDSAGACEALAPFVAPANSDTFGPDRLLDAASQSARDRPADANAQYLLALSQAAAGRRDDAGQTLGTLVHRLPQGHAIRARAELWLRQFEERRAAGP